MRQRPRPQFDGWKSSLLCDSLPNGFEQTHRAGGGNVQALDFTRHRNADQLLAAFGSEPTNAALFGSQNHGKGAIEISGVEIFAGVVGGADDVHETLGQMLEGAGEIGDGDDGNSCGGSAGDAHHGLGDATALMAGDDDGIHACSFSGAQAGTEVVGILHAVENQEKWVVVNGIVARARFRIGELEHFFLVHPSNFVESGAGVGSVAIGTRFIWATGVFGALSAGHTEKGSVGWSVANLSWWWEGGNCGKLV